MKLPSVTANQRFFVQKYRPLAYLNCGVIRFKITVAFLNFTG